MTEVGLQPTVDIPIRRYGYWTMLALRHGGGLAGGYDFPLESFSRQR